MHFIQHANCSLKKMHYENDVCKIVPILFRFQCAISLRLLRFITVTIWARLRLRSPASRLFNQLIIQAEIKENIKSSASKAFVRGIHRWSVNSPHKGPVTRKLFPFDDVIMLFHKRKISVIARQILYDWLLWSPGQWKTLLRPPINITCADDMPHGDKDN